MALGHTFIVHFNNSATVSNLGSKYLWLWPFFKSRFIQPYSTSPPVSLTTIRLSHDINYYSLPPSCTCRDSKYFVHDSSPVQSSRSTARSLFLSFVLFSLLHKAVFPSEYKSHSSFQSVSHSINGLSTLLPVTSFIFFLFCLSSNRDHPNQAQKRHSTFLTLILKSSSLFCREIE